MNDCGCNFIYPHNIVSAVRFAHPNPPLVASQKIGETKVGFLTSFDFFVLLISEMENDTIKITSKWFVIGLKRKQGCLGHKSRKATEIYPAQFNIYIQH